MAVEHFTRRDSFPSDSIPKLRELWLSLCEIQFALEEDERRYQDRRNRFAATLGLLVAEQDRELSELEGLGQGKG